VTSTVISYYREAIGLLKHWERSLNLRLVQSFGVGRLIDFFLSNDPIFKQTPLEFQKNVIQSMDLVPKAQPGKVIPIHRCTIVGALAKFFWGGYMGLSENLWGSPFSCFIAFLCDNFSDLTPPPFRFLSYLDFVMFGRNFDWSYTVQGKRLKELRKTLTLRKYFIFWILKKPTNDHG
jgi:hypothetical protein